MATLNVSFISEAERQLPARRGGSTVSGSKGMLLWAYRVRPDFREAVNKAIDKRRQGAVVDAAGCTPVVGRATKLMTVLSPGGTRARLEERLHTRDYPTVKVSNVSFKGHWICWLVDHQAEALSNADGAIALLRRFLTEEVSHVCGKRGCFSAHHTTIEAPAINVSRATCHHQRITDLCPHDPPCIKTPVKRPRLT